MNERRGKTRRMIRRLELSTKRGDGSEEQAWKTRKRNGEGERGERRRREEKEEEDYSSSLQEQCDHTILT